MLGIKKCSGKDQSLRFKVNAPWNPLPEGAWGGFLVQGQTIKQHKMIIKKLKTAYQILLFPVIVSLVSVLSGCRTSEIEVRDLDVKFISNINLNPVLSWKVSGSEPGFKQSAYQIMISDDSGPVWDTGKQKRDNQQGISYEGNELERGKRYFTKVRVWGINDNRSSWSRPISFLVPLNYPEDWKAEWITYDYNPDSALPLFRTAFETDVKKRIEYACLYICAPGFCEAWLNGVKTGKNVLDPGQTNYEDYAFYSAYDIDPDLIDDENVLGIMPGNGWYNQNVVWNSRMSYGQPVVICQLIIHYKDGQRQVIASDENWKWKNGPITCSNIYGGESYDANLEAADWFDYDPQDQQSWNYASKSTNHPEELFEQFAEPIMKMDSLDAVRIIDNKNGKYIFDFGQNFAGWTKLSIKGEKGQKIIMRHVEVLDSNNNINPHTTGITATKVIQTATYTCKGGKKEVWEPRFTYFGFRYVEVEGLKAIPSKELLKGIVVYSSVPHTGNFSCSEENINKLHQLATWTIKSNIHSIPTDCPHREKCGWTGDAHAFAQALVYNFNAQKFLTKYMFDMRSSAREEKPETYYSESFYDRSMAVKPKGIPTMIVPGRRSGGIASPDWGTAAVQLPWYLYLYYGDTIVLEEFYEDMRIWTEYVHSKNKNGIISHGLGDWCPPQGIPNIDCPVPVSSTAFHILDVNIMMQSAELLGRESDSKYFSGMLEELKQNFIESFYDTVNHTYGSQTADVLALDMDIVPEKDKEKVALSIVININDKYNGAIRTGIFGLSRIFRVLSENGFEEDAFEILTKKGINSLEYTWDNFDATTLWEVLPIEIYNERSHNHPMQAGFDAWFYSGIGGINPSPRAPGFKKIIFKPYLTGRINSADVSYESGYGTIISSWHHKNENLIWNISIPENCEGKIFVPNYGKPVDIEVNGRKISGSDFTSDFIFIGNYASGTYRVEMGQL